MTAGTRKSWPVRLLLAAGASALAAIALTGVAPAAHARAWVSVGAPCCGYWGAGPYYGYYPAPYYYYPYAPAYPDAQAYYPAAPSAYAPAAPAEYAPAAVPSAYGTATTYPAPAAPAAAAAPAALPQISYTNKPAFTNAAGQPCREYQTSGTGGRAIYGTACRQADGQWRVVN